MPTGESRIEHVVVLMLENHSFDHLLGFLPHPKLPNFDGLRSGVHYNRDSNGARVFATADGAPQGVDPDHSHLGALEQMAGFEDVASNGGFVKNYETVVRDPGSAPDAAVSESHKVMQCLDPMAHCTALGTLATEFAVCTSWFCSVPGETWPNRNFAHAATSDSAVDNEFGFYRDPTIFELIEKGGATWRVYYDGTPQVWVFPRLWKPSLIWDFLRRRSPRIGNWYEFPRFLDHVAAGDLPSYSFIEPAHNTLFSERGAPRQTNSQHPHNNIESPNDFEAGEKLIRDIYEALRMQPELFAKTLLLIVYDEHGGLYDHVKPPEAGSPGDPIWRGPTRRLARIGRRLFGRRTRSRVPDTYDFSHLGFRVPAVLVSPWIPPHTVLDERFEHASIPATLRELFAPAHKSLTKRDRDANTFHAVVTSSMLSGPRPSPDDPNPWDLPPVPVLDQSTVVATPSEERGLRRLADRPSEPGDLDRELYTLAERVGRTLTRTAGARMRGFRRYLFSRTSTLRPEEITQRTGPVGLFTATADHARRQPK